MIMLITLTTDFGLQDSFVGIMKGVIAGINPQVRVIDVTHGIPVQNVMAGALALQHSIAYFPRGTIHVAVVDPGVGSARRPILIECDGN
jgi:S-adenosylmethionine hydrolase